MKGEDFCSTTRYRIWRAVRLPRGAAVVRHVPPSWSCKHGMLVQTPLLCVQLLCHGAEFMQRGMRCDISSMLEIQAQETRPRCP